MHHVLDSHENLVLPEIGGFHEMVLCDLHDNALGGHMGAKKTYVALKKGVWWPQMMITFEQYVAACPVCQRIIDRATCGPSLLILPLLIILWILCLVYLSLRAMIVS